MAVVPYEKQMHLSCFVVLLSLQLSIAVDDSNDALLCRKCGHEVVQSVHMNTIPSKNAYRQRNDTILGVPGVLIQLFENPDEKKFEVITAEKANVYKTDEAISAHSWFPGYSWRITLCPKCGAHLGWSFEPHDHKEGKKDTHRTFVGLILSQLLQKNFADSLLITPKAYRS